MIVPLISFKDTSDYVLALEDSDVDINEGSIIGIAYSGLCTDYEDFPKRIVTQKRLKMIITEQGAIYDY